MAANWAKQAALLTPSKDPRQGNCASHCFKIAARPAGVIGASCTYSHTASRFAPPGLDESQSRYAGDVDCILRTLGSSA